MTVIHYAGDTLGDVGTPRCTTAAGSKLDLPSSESVFTGQEGLQHHIVDCPETVDCADTAERDAGSTWPEL